MPLKCKDDYEDRLGRCPLVFTGYKNIQEVYDWLFKHYWGYHFTIMLDCTKDEYQPMAKELYVYFSDEALEEQAALCGWKVVKER